MCHTINGVLDLVKYTTILQCTFLLVNVGRDSKTALYLQDDLSKVQFWSGYYPPKNSSKAPLPASPTSSSKSLLICNLLSSTSHTSSSLKPSRSICSQFPRYTMLSQIFVFLCQCVFCLFLTSSIQSFLLLENVLIPQAEPAFFLHVSRLNSSILCISLLNHLTHRFRSFLLFVAHNKQ